MSNNWRYGAFGSLHRRMNPDIDKYFDAAGNLKPGYSSVPSQQNPDPVFSHTTRVPLKGGGSKDGVGYVAYKKDTPAAAAPAPRAPAPAPAPKPAPKPVPIELSKKVATAIGRSEAYQDTLMVRDGDYVIAGDETVIDDFNEQTEQNIKEASKPYFEGDVDPKYAQAYADKHKLTLGDDFVLSKIA